MLNEAVPLDSREKEILNQILQIGDRAILADQSNQNNEAIEFQKEAISILSNEIKNLPIPKKQIFKFLLESQQDRVISIEKASLILEETKKEISILTKINEKANILSIEELNNDNLTSNIILPLKSETVEDQLNIFDEEEKLEHMLKIIQKSMTTSAKITKLINITP